MLTHVIEYSDHPIYTAELLFGCTYVYLAVDEKLNNFLKLAVAGNSDHYRGCDVEINIDYPTGCNINIGLGANSILVYVDCPVMDIFEQITHAYEKFIVAGCVCDDGSIESAFKDAVCGEIIPRETIQVRVN